MTAGKLHPGLTALWLSLISNIILTVLKVTAGLMLASPVLLADGANNASDIIASAVALMSSMVSKKPADDDHPYGHGKAEVLASGLVAIILLLAALWIGWQSVLALFKSPGQESWLALGAAVLSVFWKLGLYQYCNRVGLRINSKSVIATAKDHLADIYSSLAAVLGIGIGLLGSWLGWSWAGYADPIGGIIVSLLVLKIAWEMARDSTDTLMEHSVSTEKLAYYEQLLRSSEHVKRVDRVRAREHGHYIIVDIRVGVPQNYTIKEGHDVSRELKRMIMDYDPDVIEVLVHLNPWISAAADSNARQV